MVPVKFEFSRSKQFQRTLSEKTGFYKFDIGDSAPNSYLQVKGIWREHCTSKTESFKVYELSDINRKHGMLNGTNMKNEELVKKRAWTKICKAKIYEKLNEKEGNEKMSYREMKVRNSGYFDIKNEIIKSVFKGIWVDRAKKHEEYEMF